MKNDKTILLVEDDIVDMMSVKRALRDLKVTNPLSHVENGEEALEYLKNPANEKPAIILLDLNMPKMNGHEFLTIIKKEDDLKRIPVIVLTTSRGELDKIQSFDLGVSGYMIKPVDYQQFVDVMRTIRLYWTLSELPG
jgi:CheY-like chemotaxis protein|nr:response regulator [uncultured Methanoregula sp.]